MKQEPTLRNEIGSVFENLKLKEKPSKSELRNEKYFKKR